jgi:hypothetical protein
MAKSMGSAENKKMFLAGLRTPGNRLISIGHVITEMWSWL